MSIIPFGEMLAFRAELRRRGRSPRDFSVDRRVPVGAPAGCRGRVLVRRRGGPAHDYEPAGWVADVAADLDRAVFD